MTRVARRDFGAGPGDASAEIGRLEARIATLEAAIENFPGGISLFDGELRLVLCNRGQRELLELPDALLAAGPTMEEMFRFNAARGEYGPGDVEDLVAERLELVERRVPHRYDRTRPNGRILEVRGLPLPDGGFVTTYLDVTDQRRDQAAVAHMAHHDVLTGLPNRLLFADRLKSAIAHVRRGGMMALHYVDLDGFKPVNDRLGHAAGDELLILAARRLQASVRDSDTVALLGGDEFAVIQTLIRDPSDAERVGARLVETMAQPFRIGTGEVRIGASVGVALAMGCGVEAEALIESADRALYRAKGLGRGRFCRDW
jgi:diguanylate cyclase (GGDEF)-like protein